MRPLPPDLIAQADQGIAKSDETITSLVTSWRKALVATEGDDIRVWAGLAHAVMDCPPVTAADLLAAAIRRIAHLEDEQAETTAGGMS